MVRLTVDTSEIKAVIDNLGHAPQWIPKEIDRVFPMLGRKIKDIMADQLGKRSWSGKLAGSVQDNYDAGTKVLTIGPTAKRKQWDAGLIAELGTRPTRIPWLPIKQWAEARGVPARAVWLKIARQGVSPHPFLMETMNRPDFQTTLEDAAQKLGTNIAAQAVAGNKTLGVGITE